MGHTELMRINGVGEAKAMSIIAALWNLGQRGVIRPVADRPFDHWQPSSLRIAASCGGRSAARGVLAFASLDRGNRLLERIQVSQGGMHGTVADPKLIFREALDRRASSVILCHNHPSGQLRPSAEDITLDPEVGGRRSAFWISRSRTI
jgi:DNA repair protein RadC